MFALKLDGFKFRQEVLHYVHRNRRLISLGTGIRKDVKVTSNNQVGSTFSGVMKGHPKDREMVKSQISAQPKLCSFCQSQHSHIPYNHSAFRAWLCWTVTDVSLAGVVKSIIFVAPEVLSQQTHVCCDNHVFVMTKHVFCCDKSMLVVACHTCLLWQSCVCHDKTCLLLQQKYAGYGKTFVVTKLCLLRQIFVMMNVCFVMTSILFFMTKHVFVMTKVCLSQQNFCC